MRVPVVLEGALGLLLGLAVACAPASGAIQAQGAGAGGAPPSQATGVGDFQVGDRILVTLSIAGDSARVDTLTVREGRIVVLPSLPDVAISLRGVRRAELRSVLAREIARYVRDPKVDAKALVRLQVSGPVARPGFYQVESDRLLSDVIMVAGGPVATADVNRTVIKRGGREIMARDRVRRHLVSGTTLDELDLQAGDEIAVGIERQRNWMNVLQIAAAITSTILTIYFVANRL